MVLMCIYNGLQVRLLFEGRVCVLRINEICLKDLASPYYMCVGLSGLLANHSAT